MKSQYMLEGKPATEEQVIQEAKRYNTRFAGEDFHSITEAMGILMRRGIPVVRTS